MFSSLVLTVFLYAPKGINTQNTTVFSIIYIYMYCI